MSSRGVLRFFGEFLGLGQLIFTILKASNIDPLLTLTLSCLFFFFHTETIPLLCK